MVAAFEFAEEPTGEGEENAEAEKECFAKELKFPGDLGGGWFVRGSVHDFLR